MEKLFTQVIHTAVEKGWITINPNLNEEALVAMFVDAVKDMRLRDYLEIFNKSDW